MPSRIQLETKTIYSMIKIYCRDHHQQESDLCDQCNKLYLYAKERTLKCPLKEGKTSCNLCEIHCYQPEKREEIKMVMRYAGPRMLWRHPILAIYHLWRSR